MYLQNIKISNFRNIKNCNINPNNKINFFYGQNAQGKTNIIESIYFSSLYKSFRTNKNINLINSENEKFTIDITIINNKVKNKLSVSLDNKNLKKITINNKNPEKRQFYKFINTIIYYPDEISYLKAYPSYRRNLIDRSIFFINNEYLSIFKNYVKCLKQRNIYLKKADGKYDIWKDQLIEYAFSIISERTEYIKRINNLLNDLSFNNKIDEQYNINYSKYDNKNIKDYLSDKFKEVELKERKYGYTLVGPHIDDINFLVNNNNIDKYSSEGQKRSLLLSYKQAQLMDYKDNYGYYPILLFDDIGSELDVSRKNNIFNKLLINSGQVFITTTDIPENTDNKIFEVKNGEFKELILD